MTGKETASVLDAVCENATLWSCWGCPFLLKLVNEDKSGGAWATKSKEYSIDETEAEEEEGGQCLFSEMAGLGIKEYVSQLAGSEELTPCGITYVFGKRMPVKDE